MPADPKHIKTPSHTNQVINECRVSSKLKEAGIVRLVRSPDAKMLPKQVTMAVVYDVSIAKRKTIKMRVGLV